MNQARLASPAGGWSRSRGNVAGPSAIERRFPGNATARDTPDVIAFKQSQHLLKQRLSRPLLDTFCELTGLHLHAWWHIADGQPGNPQGFCSSARRHSPGKLPARCQTCLRERWPHRWNGQKPEKRFASLCGSMNYCACVKAFGHPCVTLTVREPAPVSGARNRAFLRAVHLTRLVLHDLEAILGATQHCGAPPLPTTSVGQTSSQRPNKYQPAAAETPVRPGLSGHGAEGAGTGKREPAACRPQLGKRHSQLLVQQMLGYIHEHYSRPIALADLAANVHLRPSYASSLFSTTLGVTFHHYLEQCRLAKAKDLLRDPVTRVSEAAYAVGYTNPNHFRNVFTARVGLSPSAWRENPTP